VVLVTTPGKLVDLSEVLGKPERELLSLLAGKQVVLAINKVDQVRHKQKLLPVLVQCMETFPFAAVVPCSALRGVGLDGLVDEVGQRLPEGLSYDPEQLTDKPERFFAAELIREAVIDQTREEVPYGIAVMVDEFLDQPKLTRITATIVVDKEAHKGIVIGKGGARLKEIGQTAREGMEAMFERKVFLELWVKVMAGWTQNASRVRELVAEIETGAG
jgi:GTP-binding protein Era